MYLHCRRTYDILSGILFLTFLKGASWTLCSGEPYPTPRSPGGTPGRITEFSWMVGIFQGKNQLCSGVLISETCVLTAAYCAYESWTLAVVIGPHHRRTVKRVALHDDIAYFILDRAARFNDHVQPVKVYQEHFDTLFGEQLLLVGLAPSRGGRSYRGLRNTKRVIYTLDVEQADPENCMMDSNEFLFDLPSHLCFYASGVEFHKLRKKGRTDAAYVGSPYVLCNASIYVVAAIHLTTLENGFMVGSRVPDDKRTLQLTKNRS